MDSPQAPPRRLTKQGLYDPAFEHDACGVGVVANLDGQRSHRILEQAIEVANNLAHRGALGADPLTGDGGGVLFQMPDAFFRRETAKLGISLPAPGRYGVAMVFFPQGEADRATCQSIVEAEVRRRGLKVLGWREVPVTPEAIGSIARTVAPQIAQCFIGAPDEVAEESELNRRLYVARRCIESAVEASGIPHPEDFYIPSMFSDRVVYKGLLISTQVNGFYQDLHDPELVSAWAIVHSRFSTNTLGSWRLAHPYRFIAHNGEINTLRGNINWMTARQALLSSPHFTDEELESLFPICQPGQSDTASFDNALELLIHTGRSLPHCLMMMIPEAFENHESMDQETRDFYDYHAALMEPWDGPAMVAASDGQQIAVVLDRNGLRPLRYLVTKDGLVVMGSETGVLDIPPEQIKLKSRVRPGRVFLIDMEQGRIVPDEEVKPALASRLPYGEWLRAQRLTLADLPTPAQVPGPHFGSLRERQRAHGYTTEELGMIMAAMANDAKEPVGSMGNDTPIAVLSDHPQPLANYFRQLFAQVTNPPLDAQWEKLVTSTETLIGTRGNLFEETPGHARQLKIARPVITNAELAKIKALDQPGLRATTLPILFETAASPRNGKPTSGGALRAALDALCAAAIKAVDAGDSILVLSDRGIDARHAPIPSLLAVAAVHHHLIDAGRRMRADIVIESGEPREVHHFATLVGYGASAINPYLAFETLAELRADGILSQALEQDSIEERYIQAVDKGIVKVMSKMGISTVSSYRGAQIFEAIGLGQELVDEFFTNTPTRIGGIGLEVVEEAVLRRHDHAFPRRLIAEALDLRSGGNYHWRRDGEFHMLNPDAIALIQDATSRNDFAAYQRFAHMVDEDPEQRATIRGLLRFKEVEPIPIDEVEPASEIVKRFATGAASFGSISKEAHETLAIAMNRIGAKSNTGEGGEDPARYVPDPNGDRRESAIKQVASGRFGVNSNYLTHATDLQIKMAQGAKPGEGGQLPGHKVDETIARVRHSTPGVELISPPPHHDIYSIEDLAQLIHDLKNGNPDARVHVKLVSEVGVGTIAAGVSKGHGDVVLISGASGGTGASPQSSIKHGGLPWELGVAETQQVLVMNDLRGRIVVQADGQLKTGRDVAIACLLGAEEFGFATMPLVTLGCIMLRKCHLNACSVGIATQDPELRARFTGEADFVVNYMFFVAEHLREIMAKLGLRTVNEMVGRVDLLEPADDIDHWKAAHLDISPILQRPDVPDSFATYCKQRQEHGLEHAIDHEIVARALPALTEQRPIQLDLPIRNANRAVGGILSWEISKRTGEAGLPAETIRAHFRGSAGQSFGLWLAGGVEFTLEGDANDYLAKGLSGGRVIVKPPRQATFVPERNTIIGNVVLYGATAGELYVRGLAGERFAVRNSGARAVVEGVGDHGCEYMTGGCVVVLGSTGRNFAAGMSGGFAFVWDESGDFPVRCNPDMVDLEPVSEPQDQDLLRGMVEAHLRHTGSDIARRLLDDWESALSQFVKVFPRAYRRVLEERAQRAASPTRNQNPAPVLS